MQCKAQSQECISDAILSIIKNQKTPMQTIICNVQTMHKVEHEQYVVCYFSFCVVTSVICSSRKRRIPSAYVYPDSKDESQGETPRHWATMLEIGCDASIPQSGIVVPAGVVNLMSNGEADSEKVQGCIARCNMHQLVC